MLIVEAEIRLDTSEENSSALPHDLDVSTIKARPAIDFGNGLLFSGQISADIEVSYLTRGNIYNVYLLMFTLNDEEGYAMVRDFVKKNQPIKLQSGSRVIGHGKILDYAYD